MFIACRLLTLLLPQKLDQPGTSSLKGSRSGSSRARGPDEAEWQGRFREFAESRDDDAGIAGWTSTGLEARLRRFLALWKPGAQGERWLDAGCGAGTYTRVLLAN